MTWITDNWIALLLGVGFIAFHFFAHRSHGGHGGHGRSHMHGSSEPLPPSTPPPEPPVPLPRGRTPVPISGTPLASDNDSVSEIDPNLPPPAPSGHQH